MKPTLIREIHYSDKGIETIYPQQVRRIMKEETAEVLRGILTDVVERGTGRKTFIKNMSIAGKTGTSQLVDFENKVYLKDDYLTLYVGFMPANSSKYLIAVAVNDPHGPNNEHTGSNVSCPIFKKITTRILGLEPELWALANTDEDIMTSNRVKVPDLTGMTMREVDKELKPLGLKAVKQGRGNVIDQVPSPEAYVMIGDEVYVNLGKRNQMQDSMSIMPVLTGLSVRDALLKATEHGLMVQINGSGKVVKQKPLSGKRITVGEMCLIQAAG